MPVVVDNKHYLISIDNIILEEDGRLHFDWECQARSTRATSFQAKKLIRRKLMSMLRRAIENGAVKRLWEDEHTS